MTRMRKNHLLHFSWSTCKESIPAQPRLIEGQQLGNRCLMNGLPPQLFLHWGHWRYLLWSTTAEASNCFVSSQDSLIYLVPKGLQRDHGSNLPTHAKIWTLEMETHCTGTTRVRTHMHSLPPTTMFESFPSLTRRHEGLVACCHTAVLRTSTSPIRHVHQDSESQIQGSSWRLPCQYSSSFMFFCMSYKTLWIFATCQG